MQLAYLPDRRREYMNDDEAESIDPEFSLEERDDVTNLDELVKDYKRNRRRGMLGWFKLRVIFILQSFKISICCLAKLRLRSLL